MSFRNERKIVTNERAVSKERNSAERHRWRTRQDGQWIKRKEDEKEEAEESDKRGRWKVSCLEAIEKRSAPLK